MPDSPDWYEVTQGSELLPASDAETVRTHPAVVAAYVGAPDEAEADADANAPIH